MEPCRILIVEDELLVSMDIQASLSQAGYVVVGMAEDYASAVSLAEEKQPDLALMDIALPGTLNGIDAANVLRGLWGIPIVFLTANTDEVTLANARAAGPYGFLTKPFRNEELLQTVRIAIEHHQRAEQLFASAQWLTTVMDSLSDAVIATDSHGIVRYLNPAAELLTEWTAQTADGRSIEEVYPLSDIAGKPLEICLLRQVLATGEVKGKAHFRLRKRSGESILIEDSAAPIVQNSKLVGAVTISQDSSRRLAVEREKELERDRLEEQANVATEALGQTRNELRALTSSLMRTQEQERHRIARELHDDIGQQIAILNMLVDQAEHTKPPSSHALAEVRERARELARSVRSVSHRLHPTIIEDLGLPTALESLVEQERRLGRDVHLAAKNLPDTVPRDTATALYRIAQEALQNAAKQAPGASVNLSLADGDNALHLRVRDDGPGFSPVETRSRGGLGLISMQERARLAGGTLFLSTRPGEGTILLARVPLKGDADGSDAGHNR